MSYTTLYKDIVFIEGECKEATGGRKIKANINGIGAQLKTLDDVKKSLAFQAKLHKCNCVQEFVYGQKSSWLSFDNVKFYGSGLASKLDTSDYDRVIKSLQTTNS